MSSGILDTVFQPLCKYLLKQRRNQLGFWTHGTSGEIENMPIEKDVIGEENKSRGGVVVMS